MSRLLFDNLSATDFEEFCFELLGEIGFINLDWRKGTGRASSPADSGRDIEAVYERIDVDRTKTHEKWFVDCKHFKQGVGVNELTNLLAWAEAERPDAVLFILSGFLTNSAKDFLKTYLRNNHPAFKIKYWERPMLEAFAKQHRELFYAFGVLKNHIRPETQIVKAENELFDRVWYYRRMVRLDKWRRGDKKYTRETFKIGKEAAQKVLKKYGRRVAGPHSDFDWGFLQGKLSAIRWVLGDEWDFLDT
jgi:hypothetical protein